MYEELLASLKEWGCDTVGAMERMLDDGEFFLQCLDDYCTSNMLEELSDFIKEKNAKDGDDMAHAIKGLAANLGLDEISEMSKQIMYQIRSADFGAASRIFDDMWIKQEELKKIIAKYK